MLETKIIELGLNQTEMAVLQLKGLICFNIKEGEFRAFVKGAKILDANNNPINHGELQQIQKVLVHKGFLDNTFNISPYLAHDLTLKVINTFSSEHFLKIMNSLQNSNYDIRAVDLKVKILIRFAIYKNDLELLMNVSKGHRDIETINSHVASYFRLIHIDIHWFKNLCPSLQILIFQIKLQQHQFTGECSKGYIPIYDYMLEKINSKEYEGIYPLLHENVLLTASLSKVPLNIDHADIPASDRTNNKAVEEFLNEKFTSAYHTFEDALKEIKKESRTKNPRLSLFVMPYYLLSILAQNDPKLYPKFKKTIDDISKDYNTDIQSCFNVLYAIQKYMEGNTNLAREFLNTAPNPRDCILTFRIPMLLAWYWIDRDGLTKKMSQLEEDFANLSIVKSGVARLYAEILSKLSKNPEVYIKYLEETKEICPLLFTNIIHIKEPWEYSLDLLSSLISKEGVNNIPHHEKNKRLIWVLDPLIPSVHVFEQQIKKDGAWSKNKGVALERLALTYKNNSEFTEEDKKAISTIQKQSNGYGYYCKDNYYLVASKTLPALVGNPNVYLPEDNTPIELKNGTIELIIKEDDTHYIFSLSDCRREKTVFLKTLTPRSYAVIEFTEEHVNLSQIIGKDSLRVPKHAKERVLGIIQQTSPNLTIQAEIDGIEYPEVESCSIPCLHLHSFDEELRANLFVRPFGEIGPSFAPGEGRAVPVTLVEGIQKCAKRNHALEKKLSKDLITFTMNLDDFTEHEWLFEDDEALDFLSKVQEFKGELKIHWTGEKRLSVTSSVSEKNLSLRIKGENDWFNLEGEVTLDNDLVMEMKTLLDLLDNAQGRFIPIGDQKFMALTNQFKNKLMEIKALSEYKKDGTPRVHPLGMAALDPFTQEVGEFKADKKWRDNLARLRSAEKHLPEVPKTLQADLRTYQVEGFNWLSRCAHWGVGACLADDMGLGKTIQALALILERSKNGPVLVVAPTSVCFNWLDECNKFAPNLNVVSLSGNREAIQLKNLGPNDLVVTSYGLLVTDGEKLKEVTWEVVILDEAQAIKNSQTKRSQMAMQIPGNFKMILTGTPMENHLGELWNLFRFINPGLLGSWDSFQRRFLGPIERDKDPHARQMLKNLIKPFILRRLKSNVLQELPEKTEKKILVEPSKEEIAFYEALRTKALENLQEKGAEAKRMHILAEITRLRQAACHPNLVSPDLDLSSEKLKVLSKMLEELRENNHKALVFSQFVGFLKIVRDYLDKNNIPYQYLDGSTPPLERQKRVKAFQAGEGDLFLISLRAGGFGLNLTAADYVFHLDPWWNPAVEDQASDRAHRIGQKRPVTIYRLISAGTIEEKILSLHNNKRDLAEDLLSGTDFATKLTEEDLLALLK